MLLTRWYCSPISWAGLLGPRIGRLTLRVRRAGIFFAPHFGDRQGIRAEPRVQIVDLCRLMAFHGRAARAIDDSTMSRKFRGTKASCRFWPMSWFGTSTPDSAASASAWCSILTTLYGAECSARTGRWACASAWMIGSIVALWRSWKERGNPQASTFPSQVSVLPRKWQRWILGEDEDKASK